MKSIPSLTEVPDTGAALLVTPKATPEQIAKVLVLGITGYSEVLRRKPTTFVYRLADDPLSLVFLDPAPAAVVDLFVDLLRAEVKEVQLEDLQNVLPVFRLSPEGIRLYVGPDHLGEHLGSALQRQ